MPFIHFEDESIIKENRTNCNFLFKECESVCVVTFVLFPFFLSSGIAFTSTAAAAPRPTSRRSSARSVAWPPSARSLARAAPRCQTSTTRRRCRGSSFRRSVKKNRINQARTGSGLKNKRSSGDHGRFTTFALRFSKRNYF